MYKALTSFGGVISMAQGQVGKIKDKKLAKELLRAGYIEEVGKAKDELKGTEVEQPGAPPEVDEGENEKAEAETTDRKLNGGAI